MTLKERITEIYQELRRKAETCDKMRAVTEDAGARARLAGKARAFSMAADDLVRALSECEDPARTQH